MQHKLNTSLRAEGITVADHLAFINDLENRSVHEY